MMPTARMIPNPLVSENPLVPELSVSDIGVSLQFYTALLGFQIEYQRPEDHFAYLSYQGSQVMIEQEHGVWQIAPLEHPYGRGINFQFLVDRIDPLVEALRVGGYPLMIEPDDQWYRRGDVLVGQREFLVRDPDGYLLRFAHGLGTRPVSS